MNPRRGGVIQILVNNSTFRFWLTLIEYSGALFELVARGSNISADRLVKSFGIHFDDIYG